VAGDLDKIYKMALKLSILSALVSLKDNIGSFLTRFLLVSQGVISRNYDDSQYDGFDS
jgi:hypothetical protein